MCFIGFYLCAMKKILLLIALFALHLPSIANGVLKGKITNEALQELGSASIKIMSMPDSSFSADAQGNFDIALLPGTYTIVFDAKGYSKKEISDVIITDNNTTTFDVVLLANKKNKITGITVKSTFKKESTNALITKQKNSSTIMDAISAETIKQVPAKSAADVVKRVSGITIIDNKYIVIRGLSDRYNAAYLNGSPLPSTDPDKKAFSFDIFPSNVLENIIVVKAATPDMPAEFAGGQIFLNSKDAQKNNSLQVQIGVGANSQATNQNYIKTPNGATDWLGMDDGTRKLPAGLPVNEKAYNALSDAQAIELTKSFTNNWGNQIGKSLGLNKNFQLSGNAKWELNKKITIGTLAAISYNRSFRREFLERKDVLVDKNINFINSDTLHKDNVLAGAMLNFGVTIDNNHKIFLKNFVNQNTDRIDMNRSAKEPTDDFQVRQFTNSFLSNQLLSSQLLGEHIFKKQDIKLEWETGVSKINRSTPDLRNVRYTRALTDLSDSIYKLQLSGLQNEKFAGRFYSDLIENIYNTKVDVTCPFVINGIVTKAKAGFYVQNRDRDFIARRFGYVVDPFTISNLITLQPNELFSANNIGVNDLRLEESTQASDRYSAGSTINAGYLMLENVIAKKVKIVYGARFENFKLRLNANNGLNDRTYTRNYNNILPSAVATYLLNDKTNIRFSASQTVSRPEFREIAPFAFFDFINNSTLQGDADLKQANITNIDARYELYPNKGEMISGSVFYKHFKNPIEQRVFGDAVNQTRTFINSDFANLYGAEAEFRKGLGFIKPNNDSSVWNDISVFGNVAYMISQVNYTYSNINYVRPMQGQSNYILNAGVSYNSKKYDATATIIYNKIGRRIVVVGDKDEPNIWEKPRDLIDFQISKTFAKQFELRFTISDLLNQSFILYQNDVKSTITTYNKKTSDVFLRSRQGTNYGFSIAYKLK
jgi:TonB dependent receptor/TonB-dependent Receptor Plug Domain